LAAAFAYDSEVSESFGMSYDPASERVSANTTGTLDYYVSTTGSDSSGNGSALKPWATVEHASTLAGPGATVHIAAAATSFIQDLYIGHRHGPCTYVSDTKWGAKLVRHKGINLGEPRCLRGHRELRRNWAGGERYLHGRRLDSDHWQPRS